MAHERLVELLVFALAVRSERHLGRRLGAGAENRELLVNHAQGPVAALKADDRGGDRPAVFAVVVEELDQGYVTRAVAPDGGGGIAEDLVSPGLNRLLLCLRFGELLALLQKLDCLHDDLGMGQKVCTHFFPERVGLTRRYWRAGAGRRLLRPRLGDDTGRERQGRQAGGKELSHRFSPIAPLSSRA